MIFPENPNLSETGCDVHFRILDGPSVVRCCSYGFGLVLRCVLRHFRIQIDRVVYVATLLDSCGPVLYTAAVCKLKRFCDRFFVHIVARNGILGVFREECTIQFPWNAISLYTAGGRPEPAVSSPHTCGQPSSRMAAFAAKG